MRIKSKYLQQFQELKEKHPEALLLFRCGDFYECYEGDASIASLILGTTLTKREDGGNMTVFPHHALDTYLPKLIRAGKRVAICDQLEAVHKKLQADLYNAGEDNFDVIENIESNKTEKTMENKEKEQKVESVKVMGIATETIKALRGELPLTLANYLYDAIGKLEVIKIKHNLNLTPNRTEIAYLIEQAEINKGK